jgi:cytochrome c-type biogenesis protein CcsB
VIVYFAAAVLTGLETLLGKKTLSLVRNLAVIVGLLIHTAALIARTVQTGQVPFTDLFEYALFMAWALVLAYLLFFRRRLPATGALAVLIVVFLLLGSAAFLFYSDSSGGMMPALRSNWLYVHVSLAALGEVFFAIGFASSLIYLIRKRSADQASLDALDDLTYRAVSMGFPIFTAGAMVAGMVWAKQAWGAYWSWDPKEVLSLVIWLVYAVYLHARLVRGLRGTGVHLISMAGFLLTVFTIFGTLVFGGLHSYG